MNTGIRDSGTDCIKQYMDELYRIALALTEGIGPVYARRLTDYACTASGVFRLRRNELLRIPGIGRKTADRILDPSVLQRAELELEYIRKNGINCSFRGDPSYPSYLSECEDAPGVIFTKGKADLRQSKLLSIVGTRRPSYYGLDVCSKLVARLANRYPELVVVSGLAYGIDRCAHESALDKGIGTIAVLGHGFRYMYPALHRQLARKIERNGLLLTDFPSTEKPERNNFLKRNRIIAGISSATIVIESGARGGALVTAGMAASYNRDVMAFPGRSSDPVSEGCNHLIKTHRASLVTDASDVEYLLGWEPEAGNPEPIAEPPKRSPGRKESRILELIRELEAASIDQLFDRTGFSQNELAELLLYMELEGRIKILPGNRYRLVH